MNTNANAAEAGNSGHRAIGINGVPAMNDDGEHDRTEDDGRTEVALGEAQHSPRGAAAIISGHSVRRGFVHLVAARRASRSAPYSSNASLRNSLRLEADRADDHPRPVLR